MMQNSNSRSSSNKVFPRSLRAETRNRAKDELKRVISALDKVRKWERRWVVLKDSSINVYKWVPVTGQAVLSSKPIVKTIASGEETNVSIISAENSNDETNVTAVSHVNEDSNAAFSEIGFDSDSNQTGTFDRVDYKNDGSTNGRVPIDFSQMVRDEANRMGSRNESESTSSRKRSALNASEDSVVGRKSFRH